MEDNQLPFVIIASFLFLFISLKLLLKHKSTNSSKLPPGPWRLPIIGNLHQLISIHELPYQRLSKLSKKYGPIMYIKTGQVPNVVISSPEAARLVMKTHDVMFAERPVFLASSIVAYNARNIAFTRYGEYWRQMRKLVVSELTSPKRVQSYRPHREAEVFSLVKHIRITVSTSPINLSKTLVSLMHCITARIAFGMKREQQEAYVPVFHKIGKVLAGFCLVDFFPSSVLLPVITGAKARFERLHSELDPILERTIEEHREKRNLRRKLGLSCDQETCDEDVVDILLNAQEQGSLPLPIQLNDIKAVLLDIFHGGSETITLVTEWIMSELLKNPRVMEKAQTEVRQVYNKDRKEGDNNCSIVDETRLHELNYLKLIIKETLRFHPPGPILVPRESREETEVDGYRIPKETRILINVWEIARDPRHWTEPDKFYPERFIDSSIDFRGQDFELVPFGSGRRMCPGIQYSMQVIELTIANLLFHFDWKLPDGIKPENLDMTEAYGGSVKRKNELYVTLIPYNKIR